MFEKAVHPLPLFFSLLTGIIEKQQKLLLFIATLGSQSIGKSKKKTNNNSNIVDIVVMPIFYIILLFYTCSKIMVDEAHGLGVSSWV